LQLLIDLTRGTGAVVGARSQYIEIDTAAIHSLIGVNFWPGGTRTLFDVPAGDFYNQIVPLDLVRAWIATQLRDCLQETTSLAEKFRVLENVLLEIVGRNEPIDLHAAVRYGLEKFQGSPHLHSVLDVVREAGLSRCRFSQLFREQVGITPKLYCRLQRFHQVVRQIDAGGPVDWADVALAGGYCDQAHLANEFSDFSGLSPGRFLEAKRPFLHHVRVD
jgi:AraC-like DNA-binding protein